MTVIENYSIVLDEFNEHECNNRVLFLGAINEMKGCYDIVDMAVKVKTKIPDIKFIIAGAGEEQKVMEKAQKLGVSKNIEFPGWVRNEEKDRLLKSCDLFLLPSYTEGMPMSILDAMGYGLPIVSSDVGGIPKIVKNDENGYMLKAGDVEGFSNAIISVLLDDEKRKSFAVNSYNVAKSKYSLDKHIEEIERVYENL